MTASTAITGQGRLAARLLAIATLDDADLKALAALPVSLRELAAGQDIVHEGDRTHESCILVDGFLQRHKDLPKGARQILAFHLPGDVPDLQSLHLPLMDHTLAAVTPSTVAMVQHTVLQNLADAHPRIARALWREALIDGAKFREWIANLGGRPAAARLAHLLCEIYVRSRAVGLSQSDGCFMPLTQARLGEALGLSVVHINRSMAALRRHGLVEVESRRLQILDWSKLREFAEFDPAYLHLRERQ